MCNFDINISLFERFWFKALPFHVTLSRVLVEAEPSLKFVILLCHFVDCMRIVWWVEQVGCQWWLLKAFPNESFEKLMPMFAMQMKIHDVFFGLISDYQ